MNSTVVIMLVLSHITGWLGYYLLFRRDSKWFSFSVMLTAFATVYLAEVLSAAYTAVDEAYVNLPLWLLVFYGCMLACIPIIINVMTIVGDLVNQLSMNKTSNPLKSSNIAVNEIAVPPTPAPQLYVYYGEDPPRRP